MDTNINSPMEDETPTNQSPLKIIFTSDAIDELSLRKFVKLEDWNYVQEFINGEWCNLIKSWKSIPIA